MNDIVEKKVKHTAREATERAEESSTKAAEGLRDCQVKIVAATQTNINAMFVAERRRGAICCIVRTHNWHRPSHRA